MKDKYTNIFCIYYAAFYTENNYKLSLHIYENTKEIAIYQFCNNKKRERRKKNILI